MHKNWYKKNTTQTINNMENYTNFKKNIQTEKDNGEEGIFFT